MKIYRPVKTNRITQKFGENKACAKEEKGKLVYPITVIDKVGENCKTGYKSLYQLLGSKGHAGTDFACKFREPVLFDIEADVEWEALPIYSTSGGHGVLIRSKQPIPLDKAPQPTGASLNLVTRHYNKLGGKVHLMRYFGHLDKVLVKKGQSIKLGQKVGLAGNSGLGTGVHLHRHLLVCSENENAPFFYLDGDSDYKGRIDEDKWFINEYAGNQIEQLQLRVINLANQAITLLRKMILWKKSKQ